MINIIDVEASGLHFDSYPIEIAVNLDGQVHSWLIKPEKNWTYWCEAAESIHGISREELFEKGVDAKQVALELDRLLGDTNGVIYSDAVEWDTDWINLLFLATESTMQFHIASIFDFLSKEQRVSFETAKKEISESGNFGVHRAEDDVRIIAEAFRVSNSV